MTDPGRSFCNGIIRRKGNSLNYTFGYESSEIIIAERSARIKPRSICPGSHCLYRSQRLHLVCLPTLTRRHLHNHLGSIWYFVV
nr:hypothetical protein [uncultured bacterium]